MMDVYDKAKLTTLAFDSKLYMYYCLKGSSAHSANKHGIKELIGNYINLYLKICEGELLKQYNAVERKSLVSYDLNYYCFFRILAAPFSLKETKGILQKCSDVGLFGFEGQQGKFYRLIRWIARHPHLMWGISPLYRHIYIPYFKKG